MLRKHTVSSFSFQAEKTKNVYLESFFLRRHPSRQMVYPGKKRIFFRIVRLFDLQFTGNALLYKISYEVWPSAGRVSVTE